jgi:CSLREA domain-containing protein
VREGGDSVPTMRRAFFLVAVALLVAGLVTSAHGFRTVRSAPTAAAGTTVLVTSAADGAGAACPSPANCTLRKAIETVNLDGSGDPLTVAFDPAVFPRSAPATIAIGNSPLPVVSRAAVTIDGSGAGVRIKGNSQNLTGSLNGLVLTGPESAVRGLSLHNFSGACLVLTGDWSTAGGDDSQHQGNRVGDCGTGILLNGDSSSASGNRVGFAAGDDAASQVGVGILVTGPNTTIGEPGSGTGRINVIGNAAAGIRVGSGTGTAFSGVLVVRNTIGSDAAGGAAPVTVGIELRRPGSGTTVASNAIANAATGISVAPESAGASVKGSRFQQNTFQALAGLAIDLNADGITNPNDDGDGDTGANGLLNHAVVTRAVQAHITGSAGAACAGCNVQLYAAAHQPGSPNDYGSIPVPGATATTDNAGAFAFDNPAVTPGQWVTALVTDAAGNTSEFGPSARVGAGLAQCGNVALTPGWNHAGFFGPDAITLAGTFPADTTGPSKVSAIYHLQDGAGGFQQWFSNSGAGRTLTTLEPGEAYWFYLDSPATLTAGFSLSVPLPIQLKAGWNDIVYIGASADVRDALGSIAGKYRDLYRWSPDTSKGHWAAYGDETTPSWARDFNVLQACGTYEFYVTEDTVLTPLQP